MTNISAAIFDWDKTLVDTMEGIRIASNYTFKKMQEMVMKFPSPAPTRGMANGRWKTPRCVSSARRRNFSIPTSARSAKRLHVKHYQFGTRSWKKCSSAISKFSMALYRQAARRARHPDRDCQ